MEWVDGVDFLDFARETSIDNIVFSANSVIGRNGLIMGAGAALRIRDAYPGIDMQFGQIIDRMPRDYLVAHVQRIDETPSNVFALQVKRHYKNPGDLELCRRSIQKLSSVIGDETAVMNCPLISLGGFGDQCETVYQLVEEELHKNRIFVTRR